MIDSMIHVFLGANPPTFNREIFISILWYLYSLECNEGHLKQLSDRSETIWLKKAGIYALIGCKLFRTFLKRLNLGWLEKEFCWGSYLRLFTLRIAHGMYRDKFRDYNVIKLGNWLQIREVQKLSLHSVYVFQFTSCYLFMFLSISENN